MRIFIFASAALLAFGTCPRRLRPIERHRSGQGRRLPHRGAHAALVHPGEGGRRSDCSDREAMAERDHRHLSLAGKGSFHRFIDNFYAGHERELAAVRNPELQSVFRRSATYALTRSIDGAIDTMQTWASDWSSLLVDPKVDLTLIYGTRDANMPPGLVAAASERLSLPKAMAVEGAGSFLLMDAPDKIAQVLLRKADGAAWRTKKTL